MAATPCRSVCRKLNTCLMCRWIHVLTCNQARRDECWRKTRAQAAAAVFPPQEKPRKPPSTFFKESHPQTLSLGRKKHWKRSSAVRETNPCTGGRNSKSEPDNAVSLQHCSERLLLRSCDLPNPVTRLPLSG